LGNDPSRLKLVTTFTSKSPEAYLTVLDPDHLKGPRGVYIRAAAGAYDVPCDAMNSAHVTGEFAVLRARDAIRNYKKDELTACWMKIAAESGNARAQAMMAFFANEGKGVPKNVPEAADWAQKSAAQKDAFGEIMLGLMYENHEVTLQNAASGQALIDRAYLKLNQIRREQGQPPILQKSQQQAQNRQAAGAALLGLLLLGGLAAMGSSSSSNGHDSKWEMEYRMDQNHRENDSASLFCLASQISSSGISASDATVETALALSKDAGRSTSGRARVPCFPRRVSAS
jgi:TPR repeat protein